MKNSNNNAINYSGSKKNRGMTVDVNYLNNYPLNQQECIYLVDLEHDTIAFQKGVQNVLGYDYHDVGQTNFLSLYCHPDDHELIENIVNATLRFSNRYPGKNVKSKLFISLRLRKKDDSYTKIFCKFSVNSTDQRGRIKSILAMLTDVSFMDTDEVVKWTFEASNLNLEKFRKKIYRPFHDFFTQRELEVIKEVCKKVATDEIAKNLFISKHTVSTHRKNILKKSECHSVYELINFCSAIGIDTVKGQ